VIRKIVLPSLSFLKVFDKLIIESRPLAEKIPETGTKAYIIREYDVSNDSFE
jgi:hypothetical protein